MTNILSPLSRFTLPAWAVALVCCPVIASAQPTPVAVQTELQQNWLNANLVQWDTDAIKHHRLSQALGYDAVCDIRELDSHGRSLASAEHSHGLRFYISDPHKNTQPHMSLKLTDAELKKWRNIYSYTFSRYPELPRAIDNRDIDKMRKQNPELFKAIKADFERTKAWSNPENEFPRNLAVLQSWGRGDRWEPAPDFQQQQVIDDHVAATIGYIRATEQNDFDYKFQGIIIDVIEQWDGFNWNSSRPLPGEPHTERYAIEHEDIAHDYQTFREGWYLYLGALHDALEAEFPDREIRFVWEPTPVVTAWVDPLNNAPYDTFTPGLREKIKGDALLDEKPGLQYLLDPKMDEWPMHRRGTASGDLFAKAPHYPTQLVYFGEISSRGGYFMSYGNFDRTRRPLEQHEEHFKLIRALSAWQNQRGTPVAARLWDGGHNIYTSPTAYADDHGLAGINPKLPQLHASLLDENAAIHLADGITLSDLRSVNTYWEPQGSTTQARVVDGVLRPAANATFPVNLIGQLSTTTPNQAVLMAPPGIELSQDLATVKIPNSELLNPGFENGEEGWSGTGAATTKIVEQPVAEGKFAAHIINRNKAWNAMGQDITGVLMNTRQGRYHIKAKVRSNEGPAQFVVKIQIHEGGVREEFKTHSLRVQPNQWAQIDEVITLDWGDWIERADLVIERVGGEESYFVDNVVLEFVGK